MAATAKRIAMADWAAAPGTWSGRVEGEALGADLTLLMYASEADGDAVPLHAHAYDELFLVREGRLRFTVGEAVIEAGAGDVLLGPAGLPHGFERIGPARAESLNLHLSARPAWAAPGELSPAPGAAPRKVPQTERERSPGGGGGRVEGRDLGTTATILFFATETAGAGPVLHVHDYDEVFVIREGRAAFEVGDARFEAQAGDLVFGPAGVPHRFTTLGPGRFETTDIHLSDRFAQTELADRA